MPSALPALIFDLDGTLTDSKRGIVACLRKVLDAWNLGDQGPLERFVGPPVQEWAAELLPDATEETRIQLVLDYRACYDREGWQNNAVFPGVREMLADLHREGYPLFVCTSKQLPATVRILDLFGLTSLFTAIYGDRAEYASHSKVELLANLIREHFLNPGTSWMIGDRIYDIQAAQANQLRSLAAGWGYGSAGEFAQADALAETPADVAWLVRPV